MILDFGKHYSKCELRRFKCPLCNKRLENIGDDSFCKDEKCDLWMHFDELDNGKYELAEIAHPKFTAMRSRENSIGIILNTNICEGNIQDFNIVYEDLVFGQTQVMQLKCV